MIGVLTKDIDCYKAALKERNSAKGDEEDSSQNIIIIVVIIVAIIVIIVVVIATVLQCYKRKKRSTRVHVLNTDTGKTVELTNSSVPVIVQSEENEKAYSVGKETERGLR